MFENVLEQKINNIEFNSIVMNNMIDYDFAMIKLEADVEESENSYLYVKIIQKNRIKESIFCYWTLLCDEIKQKVSNQESSNLNNKISISELKRNQDYKRSVILNIEDNDSEILKKGTKIYLVELEDYINKYQSKTEYNKWNKNLKNINEYMLFVGIV